MIICKKIKIYPIGDKEEVNRVYQFIRSGQYAQYQALNLGMGLLTSSYLKNNRDIKSLDFIETQKSITNSNPIFKNIEYSKGLDTLSAVIQKIKKDFSTSLKNGLAKGERCITNYKRDNPLITRGRSLVFYSNLENNKDNLENKFLKGDFEVYLSWVNKILFKVDIGRPQKSNELRHTLKNVLKGYYKIAESYIQIDDKKIILNLSIEVKEKQIELDNNTVIGVDLGIAIPAVCALNNKDYIRKSIGSAKDFLKVKTKIQNQLTQSKKIMKFTSGGHGRTKKLKGLERFTKKEKNFTKTYNHMVSKQIIDFAIKNKAKYINIEDLSENSFDDKILRNWSYYQLQTFIEYKAKLNGIEVRKIDPVYTSQTCSKCGNLEEGQRVTQSSFKCKKCGYEINADFNAARNISISTNYTK